MATKTSNKTIAKINEKIRAGKAVVLNAAEMTALVKKSGPAKAAAEVDVVTTGTFSPMCSSGLLFNTGQPEPPLIRTTKAWLNNVPAYAGLAAVDGYLGATEPAADDPLNSNHPGEFKYGGGHVIEDLAAGKKVNFRAESYGTDCYPRKTIELDVTLDKLPFAQLINPRNCYQNYNAAVNMTGRLIYTYMGPLKPQLRNLNYATSGKLSPLFNDPYLRTIGLGTRILLGGGTGYVIGAGTQHVAEPKRNERGLPLFGSGTLMLKGDLKGMNARYLRGLSFLGYGCSLAVGVGIPIPILDEQMAFFTGVDDSDILMPVKDYGHDYPHGVNRVLAHLNFEDLKSGEVELMGRKVQTVPVSSLALALEIADELKVRIMSGNFLLTEPVEEIPSA